MYVLELLLFRLVPIVLWVLIFFSITIAGTIFFYFLVWMIHKVKLQFTELPKKKNQIHTQRILWIRQFFFTSYI